MSKQKELCSKHDFLVDLTVEMYIWGMGLCFYFKIYVFRKSSWSLGDDHMQVPWRDREQVNQREMHLLKGWAALDNKEGAAAVPQSSLLKLPVIYTVLFSPRYKPEASVIGLTLCHTWKTWEWEESLGDFQTKNRCWNLGTSTIVLFLFSVFYSIVTSKYEWGLCHTAMC